MADEKAGGGGSWEWGAIEAIIAILLIIGLMDHVFGHTPLGQSAPTTHPSSTSTTKSTAAAPNAVSTAAIIGAESNCGLTIVAPVQNQKAGQILTIAGSTYGCDWQSTPSIALYAQLVDSHGKPLSDYTAIPPDKVTQGTTSFNGTVVRTTNPSTTSGYLILVPAAAHEDRTVESRIPLKF